MSRDDLLADLQDEVAARPAAPHTPPTTRVPRGNGAPLTPTLDLSVTPLRWSLPSVGPVPAGIGLAVTAGPVRFSLGVR
ncbi:MAG TPA: hypothetical protein VNU26_18325 [Mycobacteriales bacterium]|nr:hypothetical protein [Mycobacteriales bacterium]